MRAAADAGAGSTVVRSYQSGADTGDRLAAGATKINTNLPTAPASCWPG